MAISDKRNKLKFKVYGNRANDTGLASMPQTAPPAGGKAEEPYSYTHPGTVPTKTTAPGTTITPATTPTVGITPSGLGQTKTGANQVTRPTNWGYMAPRPPASQTGRPAAQPPVVDQPPVDKPFRDAVGVLQSGAFTNNPSAFFQNTSTMRQQIATMGVTQRIPILKQIAAAMGFTVPTQSDVSRGTLQWARNFMAQYIYRPQGWYRTVSALVNLYGARTGGTGSRSGGVR